MQTVILCKLSYQHNMVKEISLAKMIRKIPQGREIFDDRRACRCPLHGIPDFADRGFKAWFSYVLIIPDLDKAIN